MMLKHSAVDLPTILLLFSFMVVSAQMRLGWFYTAVTRRVASLPLGRNALLLVGSIANLIVVDLARRGGVVIDVWARARIGMPVIVLTLGVVWLSF